MNKIKRWWNSKTTEQKQIIAVVCGGAVIYLLGYNHGFDWGWKCAKEYRLDMREDVVEEVTEELNEKLFDIVKDFGRHYSDAFNDPSLRNDKALIEAAKKGMFNFKFQDFFGQEHKLNIWARYVV